jgi:hypothetical protein
LSSWLCAKMVEEDHLKIGLINSFVSLHLYCL